jgi:hypothetical protein
MGGRRRKGGSLARLGNGSAQGELAEKDDPVKERHPDPSTDPKKFYGRYEKVNFARMKQLFLVQ